MILVLTPFGRQKPRYSPKKPQLKVNNFKKTRTPREDFETFDTRSYTIWKAKGLARIAKEKLLEEGTFYYTIVNYPVTIKQK